MTDQPTPDPDCAHCGEPVTGAMIREWAGPAGTPARTWHGDREACRAAGLPVDDPAPASTSAADQARITTVPARHGEATIHLPEYVSWDTQAWSAELGVPEDALRPLRDAINAHIGASRKTCTHRCTCGHDQQDHTTSGFCNACEDQCEDDDGHYPDDCDHAYRDAVNAPLRPETVHAIGDMLAAGDVPTRTVKARAAFTDAAEIATEEEVSGPDPDDCDARTTPDNPAASDDGLREQVATAIRDAACTGPGQCGDTEEECARKRIQPGVYHFGQLVEVYGSPEMIAAAVLTVIRPRLAPDVEADNQQLRDRLDRIIRHRDQVEATLTRVRRLADRYPVGIDTADLEAALAGEAPAHDDETEDGTGLILPAVEPPPGEPPVPCAVCTRAHARGFTLDVLAHAGCADALAAKEA